MSSFGNKTKDSATDACNVGYYLTSGDSQRTCLMNVSSGSGYWNGSAPRCHVTNCTSKPNPPTYGYVNVSAIIYQSRGVFSCQKGFVLTDRESERVCQAHGTWLSAKPKCKSKKSFSENTFV